MEGGCWEGTRQLKADDSAWIHVNRILHAARSQGTRSMAYLGFHSTRETVVATPTNFDAATPIIWCAFLRIAMLYTVFLVQTFR
jgi:hypothetical protein